MNGSVAKNTRRDLRRAVGREAVEVIEAHTAVLDHQVLPNLNAVTSRTDNIDHRLHRMERAYEAAVKRHETLLSRFDALESAVGLHRSTTRTCWGRLSWVLWGDE